LNQIGTNSIKFISNSKIGAEFDFSFEFYWPLLPNILIYLQKKFYIFLRSISIFPKYISVPVLNRNSIRFFSKTFYSRAGPISRPDPIHYRPKLFTCRVAHRPVAVAFPQSVGTPCCALALPARGLIANPTSPAPDSGQSRSPVGLSSPCVCVRPLRQRRPLPHAGITCAYSGRATPLASHHGAPLGQPASDKNRPDRLSPQPDTALPIHSAVPWLPRSRAIRSSPRRPTMRPVCRPARLPFCFCTRAHIKRVAYCSSAPVACCFSSPVSRVVVALFWLPPCAFAGSSHPFFSTACMPRRSSSVRSNSSTTSYCSPFTGVPPRHCRTVAGALAQ
jgi:hypothetical protein